MEELLKSYGWGGVVLYLLIKYGHLWWKKTRSDYVSLDAIRRNEGLTQSNLHILSQKVGAMETKLNGHLEEAIVKRAEIAVMQNEIVNLKELQKRHEASFEKIYTMISDVKTFLMENRKH